jgi:hypothetical protein
MKFRVVPQLKRSHLTMESYLVLVLFLVVWFLVLPRIPGISRFT